MKMKVHRKCISSNDTLYWLRGLLREL